MYLLGFLTIFFVYFENHYHKKKIRLSERIFFWTATKIVFKNVTNIFFIKWQNIILSCSSLKPKIAYTFHYHRDCKTERKKFPTAQFCTITFPITATIADKSVSVWHCRIPVWMGCSQYYLWRHYRPPKATHLSHLWCHSGELYLYNEYHWLTG